MRSCILDRPLMVGFTFCDRITVRTYGCTLSVRSKKFMETSKSGPVTMFVMITMINSLLLTCDSSCSLYHNL